MNIVRLHFHDELMKKKSTYLFPGYFIHIGNEICVVFIYALHINDTFQPEQNIVAYFHYTPIIKPV